MAKRLGSRLGCIFATLALSACRSVTGDPSDPALGFSQDLTYQQLRELGVEAHDPVYLYTCLRSARTSDQIEQCDIEREQRAPCMRQAQSREQAMACETQRRARLGIS